MLGSETRRPRRFPQGLAASSSPLTKSCVRDAELLQGRLCGLWCTGMDPWRGYPGGSCARRVYDLVEPGGLRLKHWLIVGALAVTVRAHPPKDPKFRCGYVCRCTKRTQRLRRHQTPLPCIEQLHLERERGLPAWASPAPFHATAVSSAWLCWPEGSGGVENLISSSCPS